MRAKFHAAGRIGKNGSIQIGCMKIGIRESFTIIVADPGLKILLRLLYYTKYIYLLRCHHSGGAHLFAIQIDYQL